MHPSPQEHIAALSRQAEALQPRLETLRAEVEKVVVGQRYMLDRLLIGLLAEGHLLLEGVPGLAKTTAVKALARCLDLHFSRVQFTPDLLPADLIGTQIYDPQNTRFTTRRGPVFAHLVLADEINRAPAKVQSALLEAMQERQVTIGEESHPLPSPFLVLATQNPIEQEGTYPLPEAQMDRFLLKLRVGYPTRAEEREIMRRSALPTPELRPVWGATDLREAQALARRVYMAEVVEEYIVELVLATRPGQGAAPDIGRLIQYGASPRASIALAAAARARALLAGRGYVTPDDVKAIGPDVLRHRLLLTVDAEAEELDADAVIQRIVERVRTP